MKLRRSFLVLLVTAGFSFGAGAATPKNISFRCVTETPTTSFVVETKGSDVVVNMINSFGADYMPIHDGIIVQHDLSYLKSAAQQLTKLGDHAEFKFPLDKCQTYGSGMMSCYGGDTQTFQGTKITAVALVTTVVTEVVFGEPYRSNKVTLSVNIDGFVPSQDITMAYYGDDCRFQF